MGLVPARAQGPAAAQTQPAIATDKGVVFVPDKGTLSAYTLSTATLDNLRPELNEAKLRLVNSVKVPSAADR